MYVTPWSKVPLQPGAYYLAVASTQAHNGQNGRAANAFTLSADLTKMPAAQAARSRFHRPRRDLDRERLPARVFHRRLPAPRLRLDLADIDEDVDLLVRRDRPAIVEEEAEHAASGPHRP
ncbi:MAG: hypothetical protein U1F87_12960 [Kiritimatiellia bacterium]